MERPNSFHAKPTIDEGSVQPDYLAELSQSKGPVTIDALATAWAGSCPLTYRWALAKFLLHGPLNQVWCYDLLRVANFSSEEERDTYIRRLLVGADKPGLEKELQRQHLDQELWRRHCDVVVQYIINTVRHRIIDALFRDANHNGGYGFAGALKGLKSGTVLEQQNALRAILRTFGTDYLTDPSLPIIGQRHHELTRANRKFAHDCKTTLMTLWRKEGKASHDKRQREIIWLALRPELAGAQLNGVYTSTQLKEAMVNAGAKSWDNEDSKTFAQFIRRNFEDLKDKKPSEPSE